MQDNIIDKNLFNKKVKVTLKDGKSIVGLFCDEFEKENEILVGMIFINKKNIKKMEEFDEFNNDGSDDLDSPKFITYTSVIYDDDIVAKTINEPSFYYKTDIEDIEINDKVLVDRNGKEVVGIVIDVEEFEEDDVPYPLEKTKDIIKIVEKVPRKSLEELLSDDPDFFKNDEFDFRMITLNELGYIELTKENINMLQNDNILFIEDSDDGDTFIMDKDMNLFHVQLNYGKEFNRNEIYKIIPEYKNALNTDKVFKVINLGYGHALLVKSDIFKDFKKILDNNISESDYYPYSAYCYWMASAIEFIQCVKQN